MESDYVIQITCNLFYFKLYLLIEIRFTMITCYISLFNAMDILHYTHTYTMLLSVFNQFYSLINYECVVYYYLSSLSQINVVKPCHMIKLLIM